MMKGKCRTDKTVEGKKMILFGKHIQQCNELIIEIISTGACLLYASYPAQENY